MRLISTTPMVGDTLYYINKANRVQLPVKVIKVSPAVCECEVLTGGLFDSLKGKVMRIHVAMLYKV